MTSFAVQIVDETARGVIGMTQFKAAGLSAAGGS